VRLEDASSPEPRASYYVRYAGFDKRLDEWLPGSALEPYTSAVEEALDEKHDLSSPRAGDADTPRASARKLTRNLKRRYNEINNVAGAVEDLAPIDQKLEKEHDERTKVKNVKVIECGKHEVDAWYFSPYPRDVNVRDGDDGGAKAKSGEKKKRIRRRRARARANRRAPATVPANAENGSFADSSLVPPLDG